MITTTLIFLVFVAFKMGFVAISDLRGRREPMVVASPDISPERPNLVENHDGIALSLELGSELERFCERQAGSLKHLAYALETSGRCKSEAAYVLFG